MEDRLAASVACRTRPSVAVPSAPMSVPPTKCSFWSLVPEAREYVDTYPDISSTYLNLDSAVRYPSPIETLNVLLWPLCRFGVFQCTPGVDPWSGIYTAMGALGPPIVARHGLPCVQGLTPGETRGPRGKARF